MPIKDRKRISVAVQKRKLQKLVNAYIRKRDSKDGYFECISCGRTLPIDQCQAGHFVPVSRSQALRFNDQNIHAECQKCNLFDEFHLIGYKKNLEQKIGTDMVEWLENHSRDIKKWTKAELEELTQYYTNLLAIQ